MIAAFGHLLWRSCASAMNLNILKMSFSKIGCLLKNSQTSGLELLFKLVYLSAKLRLTLPVGSWDFDFSYLH